MNQLDTQMILNHVLRREIIVYLCMNISVLTYVFRKSATRHHKGIAQFA